MHVWAECIRAEVPGARPSAYADDASMSTHRTQAVVETFGISSVFCTLTGMRLNIPKSHMWALDEGDRQLLLHAGWEEDCRPKLVSSDRHLGAQLAFSKHCRANKDVEGRLESGEAVFTRISATHLPLQARAHLVGAAVLPKLVYDTSVAPVTKQRLKSWRRKATKCVWGHANPHRCTELVFTLLAKGHLCDPLQAMCYNIVLQNLRMVRKNEGFKERFMAVCELRTQTTNAPTHGPGARFSWALSQLGWNLGIDGTVRRPAGAVFNLFTEDFETVKHNTREDMRLAQWKIAARRRPDLGGLDAPQGFF